MAMACANESSCLCPCPRLHSLRNAIGLARVDGLAGLLDLLEHGAVVEALVGLDGSGLGVEGDVEFFDTWWGRGLSVRML